MKKINENTGGTENKRNDKNVSLAKRIVLLGIPFVIFAIVTAVVSYIIYTKLVESSGYYNLMINASLSSHVQRGEAAEIDYNVTKEEYQPSVYTMIVPVTTVEETTETTETDTEPAGTDDPTETDSQSETEQTTATTEPVTPKTTKPYFEVIEYHDYSQFPPIPWGTCWATMTIKSIGLRNAPIYNGDDTQILSYTSSKAIGKMYGSQFPGQGGRTVLCSHVTRAFYGLQDVKIGDKVNIHTFYGDYVYQVTDRVIFDADDSSLIKKKFDEETLVCYTCYPRGRAVRTQRIAIICKKISGIDWKKAGES